MRKAWKTVTLLAGLAILVSTSTRLWAERREKEDREEREHEKEHEGGERRGGKSRQKSSYQQIPPAVTDKVDYVKDVKPILEDKCFDCHADGAHKGHYTMDSREEFIKGGEEGKAVVVGDSSRSRIIKMVAGIGVDSEEIMPPKGKMLTEKQIGILRAWIDQGLKWEDGAVAANAKPANKKDGDKGPKNPLDTQAPDYQIPAKK